MASTSSSSSSENDDDDDHHHHDYHYNYDEPNNSTSSQKVLLDRLKEECVTMVKTLKRLHQEEVSIRCQNKILAREIIHCGYRGRELPMEVLADSSVADGGGGSNSAKRPKKKSLSPAADETSEVADANSSVKTIAIPLSATDDPVSVKVKKSVKMEDRCGDAHGRLVTDSAPTDEFGGDGDGDDDMGAVFSEVVTKEGD